MRCRRKTFLFSRIEGEFLKESLMSTHSLPANNVFDAETTKILASAFGAAWEEVKTSDGSPASEGHAAATRESLARHIMALAERGERDPDRLIKNALRRLGQDDG